MVHPGVMNEHRATVHHEVEAWTVGKLRESLASVPDDLPILVQVSDEPLGTRSTAYVAIAATTDTGLISKGVRGERYVLACSRPSGAYLRPKRGELIVTHGELTSDREKVLFQRLTESVREATSATGYEGEHTFQHATPEATKWSWSPTTEQPVSAESVTEAARAAATELNPGPWRIESKIV